MFNIKAIIYNIFALYKSRKRRKSSEKFAQKIPEAPERMPYKFGRDYPPKKEYTTVGRTYSRKTDNINVINTNLSTDDLARQKYEHDDDIDVFIID